MSRSWADTLDKVIELRRHTPGDGSACALCNKSASVTHPIGWWSSFCTACPVSYWRAHELLHRIDIKVERGDEGCYAWGLAIHEGNRKALNMAKKLAKYIRRHPNKWRHLEPEDLAKEVRKMKL